MDDGLLKKVVDVGKGLGTGLILAGGLSGCPEAGPPPCACGRAPRTAVNRAWDSCRWRHNHHRVPSVPFDAGTPAFLWEIAGRHTDCRNQGLQEIQKRYQVGIRKVVDFDVSHILGGIDSRNTPQIETWCHEDRRPLDAPTGDILNLFKLNAFQGSGSQGMFTRFRLEIVRQLPQPTHRLATDAHGMLQCCRNKEPEGTPYLGGPVLGE